MRLLYLLYNIVNSYPRLDAMIIFKVMDGILSPALIHDHTVGNVSIAQTLFNIQFMTNIEVKCEVTSFFFS